MSDEPTGLPEEQPVPENASPEGTGVSPEPQIPEGYLPEKDYKELQSWATRVAQENKEFSDLRSALSDPENPRFEEAIGYFGLEVPQPEPDPNEFVDPYEQRIAKLEAQLSQQSQQAQQAAQEAEINEAYLNGFTSLQNELGRNLTEREMDTLHRFTLGQEGEIPDVKAAWEDYQALVNEVEQGVFSKRKNAPRAPTAGVEAGKQPDLSTHANKLSYALDRLNALEDDS